MLEAKLLDAYVSKHPADAARTVRIMETSQVAEVLEKLPASSAKLLLLRLPPLLAAQALQALDPAASAALLSATPPVAAAAIVRSMPRERRAPVLAELSPEARRSLSTLLRYSPGTAGALMDPEVLSVHQDATIGEALASLRRSPQHSLYYVYLVDDDLKLVGVVSIRELMAARPDMPVGLTANRQVEALSARASGESIVANPAWRRFHALPVVETNGRFVGVMRYESLRELEERLAGGVRDDLATETATALGELYGLGLKGMFEWAASALVGSAEVDRKKP